MAQGLERFVAAQEGIYAQALAELQRGRKESHWMWFMFPQVAGLGHSAMSHFYAIESLSEARDYLAHGILGPRLAECTDAVLGHAGEPAERIFGVVDAAKFRSSMTLFEAAGGGDRYARALDWFCSGERDAATLGLLA